MPAKQYLLCYWLEKGVFQYEVNGELFMEFKAFQLLRKGDSAIEALIRDEECKGRNLGSCRAELTAMQQLLRKGSSAIEALIRDEENKGRNLGACRAELTAMQQLLRAGSRTTVVLTGEM